MSRSPVGPLPPAIVIFCGDCIPQKLWPKRTSTQTPINVWCVWCLKRRQATA